MKPACFVPARGGSKRIPRKNRRPFCGRPIMEYPILQAQASGLFSRIIVSSDDDEIRAIGRRLGCETDTRPLWLYGDTVDSETIVAHAIKHFGLGIDPAICMLYPTAVFVRAEWLSESFSEFDGHPIAVCKLDTEPAQRALCVGSDGAIVPLMPGFIDYRTQDLAASFHDVGAFYWLSPQPFLAGWEGRPKVALLSQGARPYIIGKYESWDIDDPEDWEHAESEYRRIFHVG